MAIVEKIIDFPVNNRGRLHCSDYNLDPTTIIYDTDFSNGKGVDVNKLAPGTRLCNFNTFGRGELSGHYILRLHWNTTNLATNDVDVIVYEDGVALTAVDVYGDYDILHGGSNVLCVFNAESEYRIELVAGADSAGSRVELDYIQLDRVSSHAVMTSVGTSYGTSGGSMDLLEKQLITITGDGTISKSATVTFRQTYQEAPSIQVSSENGMLNPYYASVTASGCTVGLVHINNANWSSAEKLSIWVWGNKVGNVRLGKDDKS